MAALVDTNIPVYRFDPRFPGKQWIATELLREGIRQDSLRVPHQAVVEFVAAVTRPLLSGGSLLTPEDARREAEEFLVQFIVLYPSEGIVRTALRGAAAYRLAWFDAHLWAYAEYYGLSEILSEKRAILDKGPPGPCPTCTPSPSMGVQTGVKGNRCSGTWVTLTTPL